MTAPKRAMVLAAGLGTRMRPLSNTRPKPLIEVAGKPLIDHMLDRLVAAGVTFAVVNVHYLGDMVAAHLKTRSDLEIVISDERAQLLDTGGGTVAALDHFRGEPFFSVNTDALFVDARGDALQRLARSWDETRMDALMLLALTVRSVGYHGAGDFVMDAAGRLGRRSPRTVAPFVWTTVQICHPRLFADPPAAKFSTNVVWDRAIAKGRLFGQRLDGDWLEINTPDAVAEAEAWLSEEGLWAKGRAA
ncbi:MAG: nucleotidyltransferase family protein [Micropepsaceae bacterium]